MPTARVHSDSNNVIWRDLTILEKEVSIVNRSCDMNQTSNESDTDFYTGLDRFPDSLIGLSFGP